MLRTVCTTYALWPTTLFGPVLLIGGTPRLTSASSGGGSGCTDGCRTLPVVFKGERLSEPAVCSNHIAFIVASTGPPLAFCLRGIIGDSATTEAFDSERVVLL